MTSKLEELYFGVRVWDPNSNKLKTINLFSSRRVIRSVAQYVLKKSKTFIDDPLFYCFGDVWSRAEWEFMVSGLGADPDKTVKVDIFEMYVEPNSRYLLELVENVSQSSAKKWLAEDDKRQKGEK